MYKFAALSLIASSAFAAAIAPPPQPVYIVLYSRFYDHSHQSLTDERLQRLLPMLEQLRAKYPQSGISALLQFSGTVSELMDEENAGLHLVDKLKAAAGNGLINIGYTGEEEPSYLYRPKANLLAAETPEERWSAKAEAARKFLNDFKNPVSGLPMEGLSGGGKRTQEVFGNLAFMSGLTTSVGGDAAATHEARQLKPSVISGIPGPDPKRGIEGFTFSSNTFSTYLSPEPLTSPEVYWQDNVIRLSDASLSDNRPHATDENLDALQKVFNGLNRSRVRVIKLEVASYKRYLTKRADGSIVTDPMEWMYYHPDDPQVPMSIRVFTNSNEIEAAYVREAATLKWLLNDFLPANPGSRFITIQQLAEMSKQSETDIQADQLKTLAQNLDKQFSEFPTVSPDFGHAGNKFFSLAESFHLLTQALAGAEKTGSLPPSVPLSPMYGPLTLPEDRGAASGTVTVSQVMKAAAALAPKLSDAEWRKIPNNAVPATIELGSLHLNAAQFLRLMEQAYLDPSPSKVLPVYAMSLSSRASFLFPKSTPMMDQGGSWTFKPALLHIAGPAASGVAGAN